MSDNGFTDLEQELLEIILSICERESNLAEHVERTTPLIGPDSPLGLDSLDAVEIVAMIQSEYGVRITSKETSIEVLNSLKTIADYITKNTN